MAKSIVVICNYELLEDRVGGMDYYFWAFDKKCKNNNIKVDWFFSNHSKHGLYKDLQIISPKKALTFEAFVLDSIDKPYSCIVTHFVELCTPFYCNLKKKTGAKIIAVDHNPRPLNGYSFKKSLKKRLKGQLYSKYIDKFIGVSQYTVNEILKDFGKHLREKANVIYNGIQINDIKQNLDRRTEFPRFIVASHLRKSKGIQDLIEAVNKLSNTIKNNIKIDIYGEGPYGEKLKQKVEELSLHKIFTFKGSVANLNTIYCKYDYMLQPTHMECFSLSILESLSANVPVITTNVGGNEEVITNNENGYIFEASNILKMRDIIEAVFLGEKSIEINTRTLIENKYSIDTMVNDYMQLITENVI